MQFSLLILILNDHLHVKIVPQFMPYGVFFATSGANASIKYVVNVFTLLVVSYSGKCLHVQLFFTNPCQKFM